MTASTIPLLQLTGVAKSFILHNQSGMELAVMSHANLSVHSGECLVLDGPSGMGKSTLLKMIYANYRVTAGSITVRAPGAEPCRLEMYAASARSRSG